MLSLITFQPNADLGFHLSNSLSQMSQHTDFRVLALRSELSHQESRQDQKQDFTSGSESSILSLIHTVILLPLSLVSYTGVDICFRISGMKDMLTVHLGCELQFMVNEPLSKVGNQDN